MLRASKTLQPCKDTRRVALVSINLQFSNGRNFQLFQWFSCSRLHRCRARSQTPSIATMVPRAFLVFNEKENPCASYALARLATRGSMLIAEYQRDPSERQPIADPQLQLHYRLWPCFHPSNEVKLEPGWF